MFFVASRGHHADIGGITPGSMPPHSKSIFEEGAVFKSFFLVKNGVFQEQGELKSSTDAKILFTHVIMQRRSVKFIVLAVVLVPHPTESVHSQ